MHFPEIIPKTLSGPCTLLFAEIHIFTLIHFCLIHQGKVSNKHCHKCIERNYFISQFSILLQANLKQFMAAVRAHNVDSVSKFTTRGLDPNFQEHDTGGKLVQKWISIKLK